MTSHKPVSDLRGAKVALLVRTGAFLVDARASVKDQRGQIEVEAMLLEILASLLLISLELHLPHNLAFSLHEVYLHV
jgi:hypothetical protein